MERIQLLGSFIRGFKRERASDVINALYIADKTLNVNSSFDFENRDNNGVDSAEIRRLIYFNCKNLMKQKEDKTLIRIGKKMSKSSSNQLKWAAQFLRNGNAHLSPEEVQKAKELIMKLETES